MKPTHELFVKKRTNIAFTALFFALAFFSVSKASDITSVGDWTTLVINSGNLSAGAGSALTSTYESATTQVTLDIANTLGAAYDVSIKRTDTTWDSSVILSARRTDDGGGVGTIVNGLAYQPIDTADFIFFSGTDDRTTVHVQMQLSNVTISVLPNTYSTTVTFTVSP